MKTRIKFLREKLDNLVKDNSNYQKIYDESVKLDSVIVMYHKMSKKLK